jgi:hypothetical protein
MYMSNYFQANFVDDEFVLKDLQKDLSWFLTRFESMSAHGCGERWLWRTMATQRTRGLFRFEPP